MWVSQTNVMGTGSAYPKVDDRQCKDAVHLCWEEVWTQAELQRWWQSTRCL